MDLQIIEKLVLLVENSSLKQFEIQDHQQTIRIVNSSITPQQNVVPLQTATDELSNARIKKDENTIFSSVVGRLHLTPDAISPPLVKVGDVIKIDDVVGWVAVLNRLLPIKSDKAGKVQAILVENYQAIEYGTPLLSISPI